MARNTPEFTANWFDSNIPNWEIWLESLRGQPGLKGLEIGCFEGRATRWLLENIFTDTSSTIDCVDLFAETDLSDGCQYSDYHASFRHNIAPWWEQITEYKGSSHVQLRRLQGPYDLVYVDGWHSAIGALTDAAMSWPLLKVGGIMIFDDYTWVPPGHDADFRKPTWLKRQFYRHIKRESWRKRHFDRAIWDFRTQTPKLGIDSFLSTIPDQYALLGKGYQLAVRKTSEPWPQA